MGEARAGASGIKPHVYVVALGTNTHRGPVCHRDAAWSAALSKLAAAGCRIMRTSPTIVTPPIGPARRKFLNAAAVIVTPLEPAVLLVLLKSIEQALGRRRGRRWGDRAIDLDIILWSGGSLSTRTLRIPHTAWQQRRFVADPVAAIAPDWRVPQATMRVRHVAWRLRQSIPVDRADFGY